MRFRDWRAGSISRWNECVEGRPRWRGDLLDFTGFEVVHVDVDAVCGGQLGWETGGG